MGKHAVPVDHLVYVTPDLKLGVEVVEELLGVEATPGGRHPGFGTRNALVPLGREAYLEIVGEHPEADRVRAILRDLGLDLRVDPGGAPALVATIRTETGSVELC